MQEIKYNVKFIRADGTEDTIPTDNLVATIQRIRDENGTVLKATVVNDAYYEVSYKRANGETGVWGTWSENLGRTVAAIQDNGAIVTGIKIMEEE